MILALITWFALLFDEERDEFNRTGNIVPGGTLISFFAVSFSPGMPDGTGVIEETTAWPVSL
jgi:hypothetical protein